MSFLAILVQTSLAISLQEQEKALHMIADFAERFCKDIPLEGYGKNIELTGKAKAELNGIINKLVNIGVEGAAKYQDQKYKGVLQKDLVNALKDSTNCRLIIWNDLKDRLLPIKKGTVGHGTSDKTSVKDTQPETLSDIIKNLQSTNVSTRISAAIKLEGMGKAATPAFPALVQALNDTDLMYVEKVAEALLAIDEVAANPHLIRLQDRLYIQRGRGVIDGSRPEDSLLGMLEIWVY